MSPKLKELLTVRAGEEVDWDAVGRLCHRFKAEKTIQDSLRVLMAREDVPLPVLEDLLTKAADFSSDVYLQMQLRAVASQWDDFRHINYRANCGAAFGSWYLTLHNILLLHEEQQQQQQQQQGTTSSTEMVDMPLSELHAIAPALHALFLKTELVCQLLQTHKRYQQYQYRSLQRLRERRHRDQQAVRRRVIRARAMAVLAGVDIPADAHDDDAHDQDKPETATDTTPFILPLVHFMVKENLPCVAILIACMRYPSQLHQRDFQGRIPLHHAATAAAKRYFSFQYSSYRWRRPDPPRLEDFQIDDDDNDDNDDNDGNNGNNDRHDDPEDEGKTEAETALARAERAPKKKVFHDILQRRTAIYLVGRLFPRGATYADQGGSLPLGIFLEQASFPQSVARNRRTILSVVTSRPSPFDDDSVIAADAPVSSPSPSPSPSPLPPPDHVQKLQDMKELMALCPQALQHRDFRRHLLPFMFAAGYDDEEGSGSLLFSCDPTRTTAIKEKVAWNGSPMYTTMSFTLLRANPGVLEGFLSTSRDQSLDSYQVSLLKDKVHDQQTMITDLQAQLALALTKATEVSAISASSAPSLVLRTPRSSKRKVREEDDDEDNFISKVVATTPSTLVTTAVVAPSPPSTKRPRFAK